ncbi:MAG: hypothetical protein JWM72_3955 [Actinomycetia bacterium]|nr:hypothetical protein [Actinomycetes bacterium]
MLDQAEQAALTTWFRNHPVPVCGCGHSEVSVAAQLFTLIGVESSGELSFDTGMAHLPLVAVVCNGCAQTRFYNAKEIGLVNG